MSPAFYKDAVLDRVATLGNVAQFVSFSPDLDQRHSCIRGYEVNTRFKSVESAIEALLRVAPDGSVNVRSYDPFEPKSREFVYGLRDRDAVVAKLKEFAAAKLHTIVNETVDVNDGGVSGVVIGDVFEFAPGDTPRCVEKPGTASLPRGVALEILTTVYGFEPALDYESSLRVEFSLHPLKRGYRNSHTIIWEIEEVGVSGLHARINWPNKFSQFLGDKAYGLLVGAALGLPIPRTTVIARGVRPFSYGVSTSTGEYWIRTCPNRPVPGRFTTSRGWLDPYKLLAAEDPKGTEVASVLAQEGVQAAYSGALVMTEEGHPVVEGIKGWGNRFMIGEAPPEELPASVKNAVEQLGSEVSSKLGPVRMEWVFDGNKAWVVQLHVGASSSTQDAIYPGQAEHYREFHVTDGIEALRALVEEVEGTSDGIVLIGNIGITSHFGDILRKAKIPSRLQPLATG